MASHFPIGLGDWWKVALRELRSGALLGVGLAVIGFLRVVAWEWLHRWGALTHGYGDH